MAFARAGWRAVARLESAARGAKGRLGAFVSRRVRQSVEPRIEAVVAEDPFANLLEVSYDCAGLHFSPLLGMTLFRPATITAMEALERTGGFNPTEVSAEEAVAERNFAVLLICGTRDSAIPCRHAERIYRAAMGPKQYLGRRRSRARVGAGPRAART